MTPPPRPSRALINCMSLGIHLIWALLIIVGASSAYFHATLSLLGQLLDEVAILWVVMAGFAMWWPKAAMPEKLRNGQGRRTFVKWVINQRLYLLFSIDLLKLRQVFPQGLKAYDWMVRLHGSLRASLSA